MAHIFVKQPNGWLALYSTVTQEVFAYNLRPDEVYAHFAIEDQVEADRNALLRQRIRAVFEGRPEDAYGANPWRWTPEMEIPDLDAKLQQRQQQGELDLDVFDRFATERRPLLADFDHLALDEVVDNALRFDRARGLAYNEMIDSETFHRALDEMWDAAEALRPDLPGDDSEPETERVGLIVRRFQPLTISQARMISLMFVKCHRVIIGIGSEEKANTPLHPFSGDARQEMIRNVFGKLIPIVRLKDITRSDESPDTPKEWYEYVLSQIRRLDLPDPTDYFTSSEADALWYRHVFSGPGKRLHVIGGDQLNHPTSADIMQMLNLRVDRWKRFVPRVNHRIVEHTYPARFRIPLLAEQFDDALPNGTFVVRTDYDPPMRFQKQSGAWVPIRASTSATLRKD